MNIALNEGDLREIVSAHILNQLDAATRAKVISQAVKFLLEPERGKYGGSNPSPIEEAFRRSSRLVMEESVLDVLRTDESFRSEIASFTREAMEKILLDDEVREELLEGFAKTFIRTAFR
jgi:hypothetical protein